MTRGDLPNFRDYCEQACVALWGNPSQRDRKELRWNGADAYSAKTFNLAKRAWYDHGAGWGGGLLDLVAHAKGQPKQDLKGHAFFDAWREAHAMGLAPDPPPEKKSNGAGGPILATYDYHDEAGQLLFQVVRFDTANPNDRFRQRRPDGNGGWIWDVKGVRTQVLYRLPALIEAVRAGQRVLITEGERDASTAVGLGYVATTMPGGVNKWRSEYDEFFRGADVVIASDNDPQARDEKTGALKVHPDGRPTLPGQDHAAGVARHMRKVAAHVRVIIFPQKDLTAWREAGGTNAALEALIDATPEGGPPPPPDIDVEIERLARLPPLDYDRAREAAAKRLAIRVSSLDTAVEAKRRKLNPPDDTAPAGLEDGVALRFAAVHEDDYRYVAQTGQWMHWRGTRWMPENTLKAFDAARVLCRAGGDADAKVVAAVERLARSDRRLAADADMWNADPWLLNTPAGVVDLRTGSMRPHRREDYCTKITAVSPRGDCPKFKAFLRRIMRDDDEMVAFLKRASGCCLTGDTSEQAIFFNYGVGSNGKTVFMKTLSGILGDYCLSTPIETFTETKTDRHPTELARLRGARLVTATETEAGRYWAESRIKEITGGERIAARFMHADFFEYSPEFKPWISGNHRPRLRSVGKAMRRRIKMIPFAFIIPDAERDRDFAAKLEDEWPGILQWMIDGCLEWQKNGLAPPEAVEQATDAYFAAEDGYSDWIADRCETSRGYETRSTKLFGSWRDWAEKAGQRIGDNKQFREEMERLGFPLKHTRTGNCYLGLRIRQDPPEPDEPNRKPPDFWEKPSPELDLAPPEPATPAGAAPAAATRVKAGEGSSDFARHARARERYFMEKPSPAFTQPSTLAPEDQVPAAEHLGVEFVLDEPGPGFTWIYRPGADPQDPLLKHAEAGINAHRGAVEAFLRRRREAESANNLREGGERFLILGPGPSGARCSLCGSGSPRPMRIRRNGEVNAWHPACAAKYTAALADPSGGPSPDGEMQEEEENDARREAPSDGDDGPRN